MATTTQKLNMTREQYEDMIFGFYGRWCESVTGTMAQYQKVLANAAINAWFLSELSKLEAEFHLRTDRYTHLETKDYQQCYNDCTFQMFNIRPSALLEEIKASQGIKVFNHINCN